MATPTGENNGKNKEKTEIVAPDESKAIILMNERALWVQSLNNLQKIRKIGKNIVILQRKFRFS